MAEALIRRSAKDYEQVIADLLPLGAAWPRDHGSELIKLISGFSQIFGFIDQVIADFFERESDPRSTREMLDIWEEAFGLPDKCTAETLTIEDRINALIVKMTSTGGQSKPYFISEAKKLGYEISIEEFSPFMCGVSECGDTRSKSSAEEAFQWQIGHPDMRFFWSVKLGKTRLSWFRAGSGQTGTDPHLRIGLATDLECLLRRWKPAHSEIVFNYSDLSSQ